MHCTIGRARRAAPALVALVLAGGALPGRTGEPAGAAVPGRAGAPARATTPGGAAAPAKAPTSGIDTGYMSPSTRPQDDLYRYLNGRWLDEFQIPADKGRYVSFTAVEDRTQEQLHSIVEQLSVRSMPKNRADLHGADARKLADLYASFMDESRLEALGLEPLQELLASIRALSTKSEIAAFMARFERMGLGAPFDFEIAPDARESTHYAVRIAQGGLGLPDRDYYLKDDAKFKAVRTKYLAHVERMLRIAGANDPEGSAAAIVRLETAMADKQWTRIDSRDPLKTYNKISLADLPSLGPKFEWRSYLERTGVAAKTDFAIVSQPSYLAALAELIDTTPLETWRSYFEWHALAAAAPYLSRVFVDERFAFTGTVLSDVPENEPRWKRAIRLLNNCMGEALGTLYVRRYFPPASRARMTTLVARLIEAYERDIERLEWMSEDTRHGAREKLAKLSRKIGYPQRWRDYGPLEIARDDLWGNLTRAAEFEYRRNLDKLGTPVDREEWQMTPQTVNAYYNPVLNEIVFPAAILQPPFFDPRADDAVNYGAIGAVIGHEISHGFDNRGSQYDADGNLRDWFAPADHEKFNSRTRAFIRQYDAYEAAPGFHVNGALTLGENIADNSGLAIAFQAYELALAGGRAPVLDGFTGPQRFYLGWAQVWRGKVREAEAVQRVKTDPHSPPQVRGDAPVRNQPGFYEAFGAAPGDSMYLQPSERVAIW